MNFSLDRKVLGAILIIEALLLLIPCGISFFLKEVSFTPFLISALIAFAIGVILYIPKSKYSKFSIKDGLFIVTFGWIFVSLIGAVPLYLSGSVKTYIDALFEIISGFTTTGSTVIPNVEGLTKGILFWRSFTHWIGGMGILIFTLALLPALGLGAFQIFRAESPGPDPGKISPKVKDTAKILYTTYFGLTFIMIIFLLFGGMTFFESLLYTFATVGTGGFATKNASVGAYGSVYIEMVIAIFMVLSGINFSLHLAFITGKFDEIKKNTELKLYLKIVFFATLFISLDIFLQSHYNLPNAFRHAFFQVSSIITTTGFASQDFDLWPSFSKIILMLLMIIGGCAGSTAGGIKVTRLDTFFQVIKREITLTFHPNAVVPIKRDGKTIDDKAEISVIAFLAVYALALVLGILLISLDGVSVETAISSVFCTLGNIGPGLGAVGPTLTFIEYSPWAKLVFCVLMLLGRLEIYTVIALFAPNSLRREINKF